MAGKSNGKFPAGYSNGIRLVDLGPAWGWGSAETRLVVFIKVLLDLLGNGGACDPTKEMLLDGFIMFISLKRSMG